MAELDRDPKQTREPRTVNKRSETKLSSSASLPLGTNQAKTEIRLKAQPGSDRRLGLWRLEFDHAGGFKVYTVPSFLSKLPNFSSALISVRFVGSSWLWWSREVGGDSWEGTVSVTESGDPGGVTLV